MKYLPGVLYVLLLIATVAMRPDGKGMESPGIVPLELATTETFANIIIGGWSADGLSAAKRLQAQDDIWIPIYSLTLALGCYLAGRDTKWGRRWMIGSIIAGACDLIENRAINKMLDGMSGQPWPAISSVFAFTKFVLVIAAVIFTVTRGVKWARHLVAPSTIQVR
jgi:hypothetical protein